MIPEAETKKLAASFEVDPAIVNQDYVLGWLLAGLFSSEAIKKQWIFKGGTSLKKCWFSEYRFSVDLDFTVVGHLNTETAESLFEEPLEMAATSGIDWNAQDPVFETVSDEYGRETIRVILYHRASIRYLGSPQSVRIDLSRDEILAFPIVERSLSHDYSDSDSLPMVSIPCYSLEEVLAEKLRAVGGQRRHAIARDVYDIRQLLSRDVDVQKIIPVLGRKFEAKGLTIHSGIVDSFMERRPDYEYDWARNVAPFDAGASVGFGNVFQSVTDLLQSVLEAYPQ